MVLLSLGAAILLGHFPENHPTPLLILPLLTSIAGTVDTMRCIQRRWSFYHGGVILCLYMDIMAVSLIAFLLFYPYALWLTSSQ